ncbi:MAG TPA: molybdate ABC transporter substrate-binding protein [Galbitalea sp.]|nr:molybdate ABC transporter substrate-binding protein [Galbitalea sp.]
MVTVLVLAGCSSAASAKSPVPKDSASVTGSITVDAASSLTGTFDTVAAKFEKKYPGTHVTFNYGGSGALAAAIVAGAPVDVFAAASRATMEIVTKANLAKGTPQTFVRNQLEIAVPAGNPGKITGLDDFADASKKIALCDPAQPCGAAAAAVFTAEKITARPDTLEPDVKSALTKVTLGEVDAAMVYHTDVVAAGSKVQGIPFPQSADFIVSYPIASVSGSVHAKVAAAFVRFVLGDQAQGVLTDAGFIAK